MKVTAINGSPRIKGNTAKLIETILAGVVEKGKTAESYNLAKLEVNPCIACENCKKNGECFYKDDFILLVEKMKESDVIIFGTPIYWWGPTAQFKAFFDRFYGIYSGGMFKDKFILLVTPFESKNESTSNCTVEMIKSSMEYIGVKGFRSFPVPGVVNKDDVAKSNGVLEEAFELGKSLVNNCLVKMEE